MEIPIDLTGDAGRKPIIEDDPRNGEEEFQAKTEEEGEDGETSGAVDDEEEAWRGMETGESE